MDLKDIQWEGVDCFDLAQDRDRWWVLYGKQFLGSVESEEFLTS